MYTPISFSPLPFIPLQASRSAFAAGSFSLYVISLIVIPGNFVESDALPETIFTSVYFAFSTAYAFASFSIPVIRSVTAAIFLGKLAIISSSNRYR
jgi:hypothetical protein